MKSKKEQRVKDPNAVALGRKGGKAVAAIPGHLDKARALGWQRRRERKQAEAVMTPHDHQLLEAVNGCNLAKVGEVLMTAHSGDMPSPVPSIGSNRGCD